MFDYVSQAVLDAERERRIRAEVAVEQAAAQIARLSEINAQLFSLLERERERHQEAITDTLDRLMPKPKDPLPGFGLPGAGVLTSEQLAHLPAVGKRGLRERNAAVREAKTREEAEEAENDGASRRAVLTPDEQAVVDSQVVS
jgi:hypothetical protein